VPREIYRRGKVGSREHASTRQESALPRWRRHNRAGQTLNSVEDELDVLGVSGTGLVGVDLLVLGLVELDEAVADVCLGRLDVGATCRRECSVFASVETDGGREE